MPVSIVHEYPPPAGPLRRVGSVLASLVGGVLILAGLLASIGPILYLIAVVASLASGGGSGAATKAPIGTEVVVSATSLIVGLWLIRGKRRLVLFLRKFGFTGATQAVTFAVVRALGGSWRLVTLDDAEVSPVGVRRRLSWLAIAAGLIGTAVIAWALFWAFGGGFESLARGTAEGSIRGGSVKEVLAGFVVGLFLVPIIVSLIVILFVVVPASFALALAVFAWSSYGAIRSAERAKTVQIADAAQIERAASAVVRRSRGIVGPRLAVAKVASSIWQPVVRRLTSVSSAVIIDVSEPTNNLLWEIETLAPEMRSRCILVGEQTRLVRMTTGAAEQESSPRARLLRLLDGEQVLAYSSDKRELTRFARSLHARLDSLHSA
jgi:hypothetical protein